LCDAVPASAAELVTSGQRVLDAEGEVVLDVDGVVSTARCEVFVSGQDSSAVRLLIGRAPAGGADVRLAAEARGAVRLPGVEGVGYVRESTLEPEDADTPSLQGASGELLVANPSSRDDSPLRVLVEVRTQATGRDHSADVAALLSQVRRTLELEPLLEMSSAPSTSATTG